MKYEMVCTCPTCKGEGEIVVDRTGSKADEIRKTHKPQECVACSGSGEYWGNVCSDCKGNGIIWVLK